MLANRCIVQHEFGFTNAMAYPLGITIFLNQTIEIDYPSWLLLLDVSHAPLRRFDDCSPYANIISTSVEGSRVAAHPKSSAPR